MSCRPVLPLAEGAPSLSAPLGHHDPRLVAARERLAASSYGPIRGNLACALEGDCLVLSGELPSFFHRQMALQALGQIPGVARLVDRTRVVPQRTRRRREPSAI